MRARDRRLRTWRTNRLNGTHWKESSSFWKPSTLAIEHKCWRRLMAENPRIKQFPNYLLKATLGVGLHWDQTPDTYTYRVQLPTREWARIEYTTRQFQGDPHQIPQVADLPL